MTYTLTLAESLTWPDAIVFASLIIGFFGCMVFAIWRVTK